MTEKRFIVIDDGVDFMIRDTITDDDLIDADGVADVLNDYEKENEQLKKELKIYYKVANCGNCAYHNYDWDIDDGYGGEEYEVCDKGNDMSDRICEDWVEL